MTSNKHQTVAGSQSRKSSVPSKAWKKLTKPKKTSHHKWNKNGLKKLQSNKVLFISAGFHLDSGLLGTFAAPWDDGICRWFIILSNSDQSLHCSRERSETSQLKVTPWFRTAYKAWGEILEKWPYLYYSDVSFMAPPLHEQGLWKTAVCDMITVVWN